MKERTGRPEFSELPGEGLTVEPPKLLTGRDLIVETQDMREYWMWRDFAKEYQRMLNWYSTGGAFVELRS